MTKIANPSNQQQSPSKQFWKNKFRIKIVFAYYAKSQANFGD